MRSRWLYAVRISTAALRSPAISRAAARPSTPGIRMSRIARSGLSSLTRLIASSPRPVSPTTSYPCSCRISLRSRRMMASSSAMTTRTATEVAPSLCWGLSGFEDESIEQLVLRALQLGDAFDECGTASRHRVCVSLRFLVLPVGQGGLRHKGSQPGLVGSFGEDGQLLVHHGELVAGAPETVMDLLQPAFDERPRHVPGSV